MASADLPTAVDGHRKIIAALAAHDVVAAEDVLRVHLSSGEPLAYAAIRSLRNGRQALAAW